MFNISNGVLRPLMSLKVKGRVQKCWVLLKGNHPLSMKYRILLYIMGVVIGIFLLLLSLPLLLLFPYLRDNDVFQSAIGVLILTFPLVTINWFIKNRDVSQQQNETLFSNALQLLFKENDITVKSVGLKELVKLKQEGKIDPERVDIITSSCIKIEKASLQRADLQEADLRGADLREAYLKEAELQRADLRGAVLREADLRGTYLQGADLRWANLQEANLERSHYDEKTQFPDGFDPKQRGMTGLS